MPACFHCGLPAAGSARFCCAGCEAVASTIAAAGLEAYYETRTAPAARPEPLPEIRVPAGLSEAALVLERVRCAACLWLIERVLTRHAGVKQAVVNYATRRALVSWDPHRTSLARIIAALRAVGYDACPYAPRRQDELERRERRAALWRVFVAAFGAMQVMMYAFPAYVDEVGPEAEQVMRWASLLITLPVVLFAATPFFSGALAELRQRRIGLDTPIALGLAFGFGASAWATLAGSGAVYFDSISMLAFLLLGARFLESEARRRAARALDPLLRISSLEELSTGQIVRIAPGERIPADGVVLDGASSADESLLTGESRPVAKRVGDELVAGAVNLEQPLTMRVTRVGADTRAAAIARLAERGTASKPRVVDAAERVARHLTWVVLLVAGAAGLYLGDAWVAIAVLVVACPCALALAAPIVLTRASGALLAHGVLLTRGRALDALARATDVVFDKTGTLTTGRLSVRQVIRLAGMERKRGLGARALAGAVEPASGGARLRRRTHAAGGGAAQRAGAGRRGDDRRGGACASAPRRSARSCAACRRPAPRTPTSTARSCSSPTRTAGWPRSSSRTRCARRPPRWSRGSRREGLALHLASGDRPEVAAALARDLWIGDCAGAMSPQDKYRYLERLQHEGRVVAMVGDGLNDAPVLARADVSFAMGGGAEAAQLKADVVLLNDSLEGISTTLRLARRAMRLIRQNIAWALAYNALALPLAAMGFIGPWEAALAMGASSLTVLLNALRPLEQPSWKSSTSSSPSPSPLYS